MEEQLRALLLADNTVAGRVATRIDFGTRPQGSALPSIVMNTISDLDDYILAARSGHSEARVQIDCYAHSYGAAKLLSRDVRGLLSGYRGGIFKGVFHEGQRDSREGGSNEPDRPHRVSMDYLVQFSN